MSGGGIRAAAFALGAANALQEAAVKQEPPPAAPRVVAVSGGSYTAAALALVQRFDEAGKERPEPLAWTEAYALDSPELSRLRRHTRDLLEPRPDLAQGVFSLLSGAAVNLLIVLAALRLGSLVLGWFYAVSGAFVVPGSTADKGGATALVLSPMWTLDGSGSGSYWVTWGPVVVLTALAVFLSVAIWILQDTADKGRASASTANWLARTASARVALISATVAWVVVAAVFPTVLYSLSRLALDNAPNPTVAAVVRQLGLATAPLCAAATDRNLATGYQELYDQARLNPGIAQTSELGACGSTVQVTVTFPQVAGSDSPSAQLQRLRAVAHAASPSAKRDAATQAATLTAVLSAIGLALRAAGKTVESAALTGWRGRARRFLVARLPIAIVGLTGLWLLMAWTFRLTVDGQSRSGGGQVVWMLLGLGAAVCCDANTMSLHAYYRWRLSRAFAAGRNRASTSAAELPFEQVYAFSRLPHDFLHVVATANVRAYDETATRRGGLPFVFGADRICWARTDRDTVTQPMSRFERVAGAGRVSVMSTVAMSGAAVGPLAGRYASRVAPYRMLLTLFNVRVGSWVVNPGWQADGPTPSSSWWSRLRRWPVTPWLISRPGAAQVLLEAVGRSSVHDRWLYLSDGGHLDNTGLVEAVRLWMSDTGPRQGRVLVVDASNDPTGSWSAVGDALAVVRADLRVELIRDDATPAPAAPCPVATSWWRRLRGRRTRAAAAPDNMRLYRGAVPFDGSDQDTLLEVIVVKAVRPEKLDTLPEPVRCFAAANPVFPRASTARQDFGDLEFEAYRALGEFSTRSALTRWPKTAVTPATQA